MDLYNDCWENDDDNEDFGYRELMCDLRSTPLHDAVRAQDLYWVRRLLNSGVNFHAYDGQARDVLQAAVVVKGNEEFVRLLLDSGANVNALGRVHGTALQQAVRTGNKNTLQLLIGRGAKVDTSEPFGCGEALQLATETGKPEVVELLLRTGANVNAYCASSMYGYAIEAAAHYGSEKVGRRQCARRLPWKYLASSGSLWQSKARAGM
ncbi:MAG: hypothetical protein FRX48_01009 [Lasallia pustulata]|uniref:Uncharacterized protein n=1 Tax=Lasallia pustulata TaxID=136370 RepID=A0A5M8Q5B8_9LECA|nr:MAG: hypothetical protein FRX48_01009 [Lasallia pustulata]